ncbi:MAG: hypothetical protein DI539_15395 [Flavobacterium psychrophilum]|nr:MAG: hypothetical protein DI539_15395 [Flavobacterium psychrophilum]
MKKIIALSFAFVVLAACSSDDSPSSTQNYSQLILGKWYFVESTYDGIAVPYEHDCPANRDYEEFTSDGVGKYVGHNTECEVDEEESGLYEIEGNILKIIDTSEFPLNAEYTITTLDEEELVLKLTINEPEGQMVEVSKYSKI